MRRAVPAPAIIDGEEWEMRDSGDPEKAFVDFGSLTMVVPLSDDPQSDLIRAHETAHVAITPRGFDLPSDVPNRTIQAAEDARVWAACKAAGISTDAVRWSDSRIAEGTLEALQRGDAEELARMLLAQMGTADEARIRSAVPESVASLVDSVYGEHYRPFVERGEVPPFDSTLAASRFIHEAVGQWEEEQQQSEQGQQGQKSESGSGEQQQASGAGESGEGEEQQESSGDESGDEEQDEEQDGEGSASGSEQDENKSEEFKPVPQEQKEKFSGEKDLSRPFKENDTGNEAPGERVDPRYLTEDEKVAILETLGDAGEVGDAPLCSTFEVVRLPLTEKHVGAGLGYRYLSADSGSVPRRLERLTSDGAVFRRKTKSGKGSILLDVSGSMGLIPEELADLIFAFPLSTIAQYSGVRQQGRLDVLADAGKHVHSDNIPSGLKGNVCDVQAVEWLRKQQAPRFWISDGDVTGRNDKHLAPRFMNQLVKACVLGRIRRFGSVAELLFLLERGKL